jgi:hypothetical protein
MAGTALYLAMASLFRYQDDISRSIKANGDLGTALVQAAAAPSYLVLRGFCGIFEPRKLLPTATLCIISLAASALVLLRYRRSPEDERRWIRVVGVMIAGGYGLIYCVRARLLGVETLLAVQRYHLFPCVGLTLLLSALFSTRLRRLDARPATGLGLAAALAFILVLVNARVSHESLRYFSLQTDQRLAMRALDRLAAAACDLGLTRAQVLEAFDPIEPRWSFANGNILRMLPETMDRPGPRSTPDDNRVKLLGRLNPQDRSALLSCVNLTGRMIASVDLPPKAERRPLEPVKSLRLDPTARLGHYRSLGWPAFLEFSLPDDARPPVGLEMSGLSRSTAWELWWTAESTGWSPDRIVLLKPRTRQETAGGWVLPLQEMPGLEPQRLRRVRLMARDPGPVSLEHMRLIR